METHESYQGQQEVNIAAPLSKVSAWLLCLCLLSVHDGDLKWELSLHDTTVMSRSLYMTMTCVVIYSLHMTMTCVVTCSLCMTMTCVVMYSLYMTMTCSVTVFT